jgi:outer membrane protein OmpA-like peptidoglycan-associated protein
VRKLALGAVAVISVEARADVTRNIDLTAFDPTPTTDGSSFHVQNANVGDNGELVVSTWLSYANNPLVLQTVQNPDPVVEHRTMLALGGGYAFADRFEVGARMPFYLQSGMPVSPPTPGETPMFGTEPADGAVLGDLALHGKVRIVGTPTWGVGFGLTLKLPTATDDEFAGTDMPSVRALALASFTPSPQLAWRLNAGAIVRKSATFANIEQGSGVAWGAGLTYRVTNALFADLEAFGDALPGARIDAMKTRSAVLTFEGLVGMRYQASRQLGVGVAAGRGLTNDFGTPELRGVVTLAFTPNAQTLAPLPKRTEQAADLSKEDTDFDKINDAVDKCPELREDRDGFEDTDGCPDEDNDRDELADGSDKCPLAAEDADGFEDSDGCPDDDNDKDGLVDDKDACRNEAEKINGVEDDDGCPDKGESLVISTPDRLELLESVLFTGDDVSKASANVLGQLATTLRARTDILRVRITVHVQPTKSAQRDKLLSEKRAHSVREWLVAHGIADERIETRGFGSTNPLVPATQKGAAQINDRLELIILERQ